MLFPRAARSYKGNCRTAVSAGFGLGIQCCSLAQRGPTGLGFREIWFGNAMLFPRKARSYRAWLSRDLVWECDAVPSRSEVLQGLAFAGFGLGMRCCSLAQRGPTKVIVGPRFARDLIWECDAVPSRSEVLQELDFAGFGLGMQCCSLAKRGPTGLGFRGIWFGNSMLFPRKARSYSGLLLQEYAIPMAVLTNMVNDFCSFRVGNNVPCCFDRFFIRAHSPVIEITLPLN